MSVSLLEMLQRTTPTATQAHMASSAAAASSGSPSSSSSSSSTTDPGLDLTNTFLQLLTVQLQNQSPLDPLDPNAFITQLAQFDSLGELTQIQQSMQTLVNDVGSVPGSAAGAAAGVNANSSSSSNAISNF